MPSIRTGDKVCFIMNMSMKGTVVETYERRHNTMMVDGPLSTSIYARVRLTNPRPGVDPLIECRLQDLMRDD
jgi:hypothetical protein